MSDSNAQPPKSRLEQLLQDSLDLGLTSQSLNSNPISSKSEDYPQAGFSERAKLAALELKARILAGESVPLEELRTFLQSASNDMEKTRVKRVKPLKDTDVDFF